MTRYAPAAALAGAILSAGWAGGPALAADQERRTLLDHKDWVVDEVWQDGEVHCDAYTSAGEGIWFSLYVFPDHEDVTLVVENPGWDLTKREAEVSLAIDRDSWSGVAELEGELLVVRDLTDAFLTDIQNGRDAAIMDEYGNHVLEFSLRGSAAAILKLYECWDNAVANRESDPSDPFARSGAGTIGDEPRYFGR
ncbi:hypothetical protein [Oceanomicrobium pacificus]|uniref:Uncharacterized protein n=1 Tax=Oceanomicrobium pacificus TaxID=2692916 RepID=A0A6B0TZ99_9RHOB|nr:hypothetical protein [Oceanomicrobium pacificus]MXU66343.1 hypothetical protein [Oceanomicrobium pacificus]